jgi:hypothetical protein
MKPRQKAVLILQAQKMLSQIECGNYQPKSVAGINTRLARLPERCRIRGMGISAQRRNELASMTVEELQKRSESNKKRIGEILETLLS